MNFIGLKYKILSQLLLSNLQISNAFSSHLVHTGDPQGTTGVVHHFNNKYVASLTSRTVLGNIFTSHLISHFLLRFLSKTMTCLLAQGRDNLSLT